MWMVKNISPEYFLQVLLETVVSPPFFSKPAQAWVMVEGSYIFTHTYVLLEMECMGVKSKQIACSHTAQTVGTKLDHSSTWYEMTIIKMASTDQKSVMWVSTRCPTSNPMHNSDKIDSSLFDTIFVSNKTKGQVGLIWAWSSKSKETPMKKGKTWRT